MDITRRKKRNKKSKLAKKNIKCCPDISEVKAKWVCISIAERYKRINEFHNALEALKKIFGKDLIHILIIGQKLDDFHYFNEMDGYVFVKVHKIYDHVETLKNSKFVETILCSYENMSFIEQKEISSMIHDYKLKQKNKKDKSEIYYGDIVEIKSGKYESLHGIVIDSIDNKYLVEFKFNIGLKRDKIKYENMTKKNNFFDKVKYPV